MPALTRRSDPDANQETWLIHYDDIRVGSIAMRAGVPTDKDQWGWSVGFYPPADRGLRASGTAKSFDAARAAFDVAWQWLSPKFTEADFTEYRRHRAFDAWKRAMWDAGCKLAADAGGGWSLDMLLRGDRNRGYGEPRLCGAHDDWDKRSSERREGNRVTDTTHAIQAPCSTCLGKTTHTVLFQKAQQDELYIEKSALIECCGCGNISMGLQRIWTSSHGEVEEEFYPAPITRRQPFWVGTLSAGFYGVDKQAIGGLLAEVYQAIASGQRRLAAMGIRAALEQVMITTVGDLRTFDEKLDAFQNAGYISLVQRDAMRATLTVGDAAMHRGHLPSDKDLSLALDIVEGVFAPIFAHKDPAQKLGDAVPPRVRPPKRAE